MSQSSQLPAPSVQADRLVELGVPQILGVDPQVVAAAGQDLERVVTTESSVVGSLELEPVWPLLVPSRDGLDYAALLSLVEVNSKPGFVVEDLHDLDSFLPTAEADVPEDAWYGLVHPVRGDEYQNASPAEALTQILAAGRTPMTFVEGLFWLLAQPETLSRNNCFMTIGSRKIKPNGEFDSRTLAYWISNGTGRDGADAKNAPKLGWCWWNNRHTWLGIAHASHRLATQD